MNSHELSPGKITEGGDFLALLDSYGLGVQGAAWIYASPLQEWRYYIVTTLVQIDGLIETHKRIEQLFNQKFNHIEMVLDDLYLGAPDEEMFATLASMFKVNIGGGSIEFRNVQINNLLIEHAYIYRLDKAIPVIKAKQARHQFDKLIKADPSWDEGARLIDLTSERQIDGTLAMCVRRWLELSDEHKSTAMISWGYGLGIHGTMHPKDIRAYINRHGLPPGPENSP